MQFHKSLFFFTQDHRQSYDKNDIRDIIDMYFTEVDNLTDSGKIEENAFGDRALSRSILDLFLAGTDTTTNSLMWSLMYMAINHDVQNMVRQLESNSCEIKGIWSFYIRGVNVILTYRQNYEERYYKSHM